MRFLLLALLLLFLTSACATAAEELLPIDPSIKGASRIGEIEVTVRRDAAAAVAASDERLGPTGEPFAKLLERSIREAAEQAGLTSGRALKLVVEVDALQLAGAGSALLGRDDRLEGSVFLRDAATGAGLGQLYVEIDRTNGGLISALSRIGNVRESLTRQFAADVTAALRP